MDLYVFLLRKGTPLVTNVSRTALSRNEIPVQPYVLLPRNTTEGTTFQRNLPVTTTTPSSSSSPSSCSDDDEQKCSRSVTINMEDKIAGMVFAAPYRIATTVYLPYTMEWRNKKERTDRLLTITRIVIMTLACKRRLDGAAQSKQPLDQ